MGMRIQNEQSGSSSLFAQPMALEPVPEEQGSGISHPNEHTSFVGNPGGEQGIETPVAPKVPRTMLEARMEAVLEELMRPTDPPNTVVRQGHLALLKRWYYRPEVKREGEVCFPDEEGRWPIRSMLRSVGRVAAKAMAHPART